MNDNNEPAPLLSWLAQSPLVHYYSAFLLLVIVSSLFAFIGLSFERYLFSTEGLSLVMFFTIALALSPLLSLQKLKEESPEDALIMTQIALGKIKKAPLFAVIYMMICVIPSVITWSNMIPLSGSEIWHCTILERSSPELNSPVSAYFLSLSCPDHGTYFLNPPPLKHWTDFNTGRPVQMSVHYGWLGFPFWGKLTP